ncbi:Hypothetical predicted protein [Paramuricea clavata]|uniref:Uncharacterized protein n=1 Tax=Paramuricea clavata TaxID=317549 RepID=A0A6S7GNK3_PARCT|nr:Hypothetical predicted protein [Paramuricea clavata]
MADDEQAAQPVTISTPSVSIQPLPEFNPDAEVGASLATRWTNWLDDFEMFILASGITDEKRKHTDFKIEQQIVTAGSSSRIRKKALRNPTYDLKAILIDGRCDEQSAY